MKARSILWLCQIALLAPTSSANAWQYARENENALNTVKQRQQVIDIYLDIQVNEQGQVSMVKLADQQKPMGIFTDFAIKKVQGLTFPKKLENGSPKHYWIKNYHYQSGKLTPF